MCVVLLRVLVAFWLETLTTCLATQQAAGAGVAQRGWSSAADAAMMEDNSPTVIKMKGIELKGRPLYLDMQVTEPLCRGSTLPSNHIHATPHDTSAPRLRRATTPAVGSVPGRAPRHL